MKTVLRVLSSIAFVLCLAVSAASGQSPRPNIVLIMADDMGWSDLGCYGGEIDTPNLDALAGGGVRFTQFYNTGRCCPTRAALLTGLYSHQAGIGHMTGNDGIPSYQGFLNDRCATIAEALRPAGYATLMTGKWHVGSAPGQWPLDRGFDRFWGTPSGGGVYFADTLKVRPNVFFVDGDRRIEPPEDLYVTETFTTEAIEFVEESVRQDRRPFFLYLAHIAPHWPLQAKPEDIAKYRGRYDAGWDVVRDQRFDRQKKFGLLPSDIELSPRHPLARAWDDVPEADRRELAHRMEIYAAQVDCIDQNVGRLVAKLTELGQLENTLILFLSDNGCSAEGGPGGFSRGEPGAAIGSALSYASAGLEWANACNTPFRKFKMDTYQGGIATPLIVHWPAAILPTGAQSPRLVHKPAHVIDLMPTLLDIAGVEYPERVAGKELLPLEGRSLKPQILQDSAKDPTSNNTAASPTAEDRSLFWEHEGNRAVRKGDWKAVAANGEAWELYNLADDRTELRNLAATQPEKLDELVAQWRGWTERAGVWEWKDLQEHRQTRSKTRKEGSGAPR